MNLDFKKSKQHFIFKTKYRIKLQTKPICPPPLPDHKFTVIVNVEILIKRDMKKYSKTTKLK